MNSSVSFLVVVSGVLATMAVAQHPSQVNKLLDTTAVPVLPYKAEMRVKLFPTVSSKEFHYVNGMTVSIEYGYSKYFDRLYFDYLGSFPIEGEFNQDTGVLTFSGEATTSEYNVVLSSVTFITSSDDGNTRQITWAYGNQTIFASSTGHFYQYYRKSGIAWQDAKISCDYMKLFGMQGYLATITSQREMNEVGGKAPFNVWLGGSDRMEDGTWKWQAGPEKNDTFWTGMSLYADGATPPLGFARWYRFQPDDISQTCLSLYNTFYHDSSYWMDNENTDAMDGFVCEYGGIDSTEISDTMSSYHGSVKLQMSCPLFTGESDCKNRKDFGCDWISKSCQRVSCEQHALEGHCNTDWRCAWNIEGTVGTCVNTRCSKYGTKENCEQDPACTPKGYGECHVARCEDMPTACTCANVSQCVWRSGRCGMDDALDCNKMDVVYLIDGTAQMTKTFGRFPHGFLGLGNQLLNAQPVLTLKPAGVLPTENDFGQRIGFVQYGSSVQVTPKTAGYTGGELTGSRAEVENDIAWHLRNFKAQDNTKRAIGTALRQAQTMFRYSGNRKKVIVIVAAGALTDSSKLAQQMSVNDTNSVLRTLDTMGVHVTGIALQSSDVVSERSQKAEDSLMQIVSHPAARNMMALPLAQFRAQAVYGLCGSNGMLGDTIQPGLVSTLCRSLPTENACNANDRCAWDAASNSCRNTQCMKYCTAETCSADPSCGFVGTRCLRRCNQITSNETCGVGATEGVCEWKNDRCSDVVCVGNPTEDGCIADLNGCQYNPSNNLKCMPTPCNAKDQNKCLDMSTPEIPCAWNGRKCYRDVCGQQASVGKCAKLSQCMWSGGQCTPNTCGQYQSENHCDRDWRCTWDVASSPPSCGPAPCTNFNEIPTTAKSNCATDSRCTWQLASENKLKDMCVVKTCQMNKRACDCHGMDGCVWRNDQCRDTRFVQCPQIDVIFLVEGTHTMQDDFGRHPNGFIGIVEAIRSWSKEVPFSETLNARGFRLGMIQYGPANIALEVSPGFGGGGNLTMVPSQWYGLDGDLDRMEAMFTAERSSVSIKPGLQAAYNMFMRAGQGSVPRKRMLVILGTNPISDGANKLDLDIEKLHNLGVSIFTNVVRRFSYITPLDIEAAEYLSPLAGDPQSIHFSYTTIDTMKSQLLENFCDPSTGPGEVLEVSRDGELPCDWLVGETECNVQGSCQWDSQAVKSCPDGSNGCPNLDCQPLPDFLQGQYECKHCVINSGAFLCSRSTNNAAAPGMCVKATCGGLCETDCGANANCTWNGESSRCERAMCGDMTLEACNNDQGCIWDMTGETPMCRKSVCGKLRDVASCAALTVSDGKSGTYQACTRVETLVPAICQEQRCPKLKADECQILPDECNYDPRVPPFCTDRSCKYDNPEHCNTDATCYWNPYATQQDGTIGKCFPAQLGCVLSGYSQWSQCSSNCGAATQFKSRTVVQPPTAAHGQTCLEVADLGCFGPDGSIVRNCDQSKNDGKGDDTMVVTRDCAFDAMQKDCNAYCSSLDRNTCIQDISCMWQGGCQPSLPTCADITDKTKCDASDSCQYDTLLAICKPVVEVCRYDTAPMCEKLQCQWKTGRESVKDVQLPTQLINPGQPAIMLFPGLTLTGDTIIKGATVSIENGYQRGKDLLQLRFAKDVNITWLESSGTLRINGSLPVREYGDAIALVMFSTTSLLDVPRTITWSLGDWSIYSASTGHHYMAVHENMMYSQAKAYCANNRLLSMTGYLATIMSVAENTAASTKAGGKGWISGDNTQRGMWKYDSGPEQGREFWNGGAKTQGGMAVNGAFTNWEPPSLTNPNGQPSNIMNGSATETDRVYLATSGFWRSLPEDSPNVMGFVCEFEPNDQAQPTGGALMVGIGGCLPTMCVWHKTQQDCSLDVECWWDNGRCIRGCRAMSTEEECATVSSCKWDTSVLPAMCDVNQCRRLGIAPCEANPVCTWNGMSGACEYKTGCFQFNAQQCSTMSALCMWSSENFACETRTCDTYTSPKECESNPLCDYNIISQKCDTRYCVHSTENSCSSDNKCNWLSSSIASVGFPPGGAVILPFSTGVEAPLDISTMVDGATVMITEGFQKGYDELSVRAEDNSEGNFEIPGMNPDTGVLKIKVNPGIQINTLTMFEFIKKNVRFATSSTSSIRRRMQYALGYNLVYSDLTDTYLKYIEGDINTFEQAKQVCADTTFYSLSGCVATVSTESENILLKKIQPSGFIGAESDGSSSWSWSKQCDVNQNPLEFWQGAGSSGHPTMQGNTSNYAQWDLGQPAKDNGIQQYGFILRNGMWMAVKDNNTPQQKGVVCEYHGTPSVSVAGIRIAQPQGCFLRDCVLKNKGECQSSPMCSWKDDTCGKDESCAIVQTLSQCKTLQKCFWNYDTGVCLPTQSVCTQQVSQEQCADFPDQCEFKSEMRPSGCVRKGCSRNPEKSSCEANALCRWSVASARCVPRLCGWTQSDQCWKDSMCMWVKGKNVDTCQPNPCGGADVGACASIDSCFVNSTSNSCQYRRCGTGLGKEVCQSDSACLFHGGGCKKPDCSQGAQKVCDSNHECYFNVAEKKCQVAQCYSNTDKQSCEQGQTILALKPCIWVAGSNYCREKTYAEGNAPQVNPGNCQKEKNPNLWWLWLLLAIIIVLLLLVFYRLYLAFSKGLSFFEPTRKNYRYSPHQQYAKDLFEESKDAVAVEHGGAGAYQPMMAGGKHSIQDL